TRFSRDWSSDVCSSDLHATTSVDVAPRAGRARAPGGLGACSGWGAGAVPWRLQRLHPHRSEGGGSPVPARPRLSDRLFAFLPPCALRQRVEQLLEVLGPVRRGGAQAEPRLPGRDGGVRHGGNEDAFVDELPRPAVRPPLVAQDERDDGRRGRADVEAETGEPFLEALRVFAQPFQV